MINAVAAILVPLFDPAALGRDILCCRIRGGFPLVRDRIFWFGHLANVAESAQAERMVDVE
jgi:hypothetical protein